MLGTEGQLNFAQHRSCLISLRGQLTCCQRTLRFHCLHEGSICKSIFSASLVTLPRALIGALLEKRVGQASRLLLGRDPASRIGLEHRIGKGQGCNCQHRTRCDDEQYCRGKCRPMARADRRKSDHARAPMKHPLAKVCTPQEERGKEEDHGPQGPVAGMQEHVHARLSDVRKVVPGAKNTSDLSRMPSFSGEEQPGAYGTTAASHFREIRRPICGTRLACIAA